MTITTKLFFSHLITAVFAFCAGLVFLAFLLRPQTLEIDSVDLNGVSDGTYLGVCQNKILFAVVKVAVKNHQIDKIEILEHKASYWEQAEQIAATVCAEQSLEVAAISGATLTSDTVLKAIENALEDGQQASDLTK